MAKTIRSPADASKNWKERGSASQQFWQQRASQADWQGGAGSQQAENNFKTSMQAVIANGSRQKGVQSSSNQVYASGVNANAGRFSAGISASQPKMDAFFGKFLPAVDGLRKSLPARGVRGSTDNITRATQMMTGLSKMRGQFKVKNVARSQGV